ncbi:MAG: NAD(P) transhydrogenase subunit alpha [Planctomycetes bacterium]|nr:NAD(P) transhydrogenase subunit alpha [Planctomycetota bacterium]
MTWSAVYLFILAGLAGFEVIARVPPLLHTPLMSGTNAISGIAILGALAATGSAVLLGPTPLGFFAVALAAFNVVGGFLVTDRMLRFFRKKREPGA